jgi:hypothetical protein
MLNPKMLVNSGVGDVFVEIGGADWLSSFVVAVYLALFRYDARRSSFLQNFPVGSFSWSDD